MTLMTLNGHFTLNSVFFQVQNLLIYLHGQRHDIYGKGILVIVLRPTIQVEDRDRVALYYKIRFMLCYYTKRCLITTQNAGKS